MQHETMEFETFKQKKFWFIFADVTLNLIEYNFFLIVLIRVHNFKCHN